MKVDAAQPVDEDDSAGSPLARSASIARYNSLHAGRASASFGAGHNGSFGSKKSFNAKQTVVGDYYEEYKRKKKEKKHKARLRKFLDRIQTSHEVFCTVGHCISPIDSAKLPHQRIRRCGLAWEEVPLHEVSRGVEIYNDRLAAALLGVPDVGGVKSLEQQDLDAVDDGQLTYSSYVKAGPRYFRPKVVRAQCSKCKGNGGKAGGLFSGETILHIAIVQHRMSSIEWLLRKGSHIDDRALGLFFQDALIPKFQDDISLIQQHGFEPWKLQANELGGACNYGQFPLSFAAAVGDEHICHLLWARAQHLIHVAVYGIEDTHLVESEYFIDATEVLCLKLELDAWVRNNIQDGNALLHTLGVRIARALNSVELVAKQLQHKRERSAHELQEHHHDRKQALDSSNELRSQIQALENKHSKALQAVDVLRQRYVELLHSAFLNRRDSAGDTALHLAVRHRRISTIDWLLQSGAMPSLELLNNKNYTPLTLAVRQGDVKTFSHVFAKQRQRVWSYGKPPNMPRVLRSESVARIMSLLTMHPSWAGTVCMAITPLEQVDTFRIMPSTVSPTGEIIPDPSVLHKPSGYRRFLKLHVLPEFLGGIPRGQVSRTKVFPAESLHDIQKTISKSIATLGSSMFGLEKTAHDSLVHQSLGVIIEGKIPPVYTVRECKHEQNVGSGAYLHQDEFWRSGLEIVIEHVGALKKSEPCIVRIFARADLLNTSRRSTTS